MAQIIIDIGATPDDSLGTPLRQAFADINQMFSEVYLSGPVDSSVRIANNAITTTVINSNLILSPSGIGKIQANNSVVPAIDDVYELGSPTRRFNSVYVGTGGFALTGNINVDGNVVASGNVFAEYFVGNGALLTGIDADTTKIINGNSEIQAYANGNIAVSVSGISNTAVFSSNQLSINTDTVVSGNLTVNGNVKYINVTNLNIQDPVIGLGRGANDTPLTSNDGFDRGTQLWYYNTQERSAFFGFDNSTGNIFAAVDVSVANEIVTVNDYGTMVLGNIVAENVNIGNTIAANNISAAANIVAAGNITGDYIIAGTAIVANVAFDNINTANITASGFANITGNVTSGNVISSGDITAVGNISGNYFVGNGTALIGVMADRGAEPSANWNNITNMGMYTINRTSWSGTQNTPIESNIFVGMLEVKNSTGLVISQTFWPGTVEISDVKLMWVRNYWDGVWTDWQKMINGNQTIDGGDRF
jgi:hypothetical protein